MQVSRAEHQGQDAEHGLVEAEAQLAQQAERNQRRQNIDQNIGAVADNDAAYRRVILVFGENVPVGDPCGDQICGKHEQRLADAVPAEDAAAAAVQAELGILVGKHLRLRGPEPVRGLQAVHGVGGTQFARLHHEREQARGQAHKEERIPQLRPQA